MMNRVCHILLFLGLAAVVYPPFASPQQLEIHCIDVGQGSSELVIGPNGTTILIDGGTSSKGRDEVIPYLNALFAPATPPLDYIIASHDDNDHYGGLNYVIDYSGYSIGTIYHCGDNAGFGEGGQIPLGTVIDLGDGARATCVGRYGEFIDGSSGGTSSNNLSVCLLIEYGGFDYVTAGDLETNEDELSTALIGYPPAGPYLDPACGADVIHVNHHGSDGASKYYYINRLIPEVALINGGTNYGHPRWTAVDRLKGRTHYTIPCSCNPDMCGAPTYVTVSGAAVFRTTAASGDCTRASEADCPTLGDIVVTYDGCAENYYVAGTAYPVDEWIVCTTPTPTPEGYHTPSPTPSPPPTPSPTPTLTATPTTTPTPDGYITATPTATPSSDYCSASGEYDEYIARVQFNTIDNSSGREGYADYTAFSAVISRETAYGITVTNPVLYTGDACDVWVDWNQNRSFYDAGESTTLSGGPAVFTGTITSPAGALPGETRLRIRLRYYQDVEPCGAFTYGEVEDYTVIVVSLVTPTPEGDTTPTPTPTTTPTPSATPTPTMTPTPSITPIPITPTPSVTPSPSPVPRPTSVYLVVGWDDYDGDGYTDYALFRDGTWNIMGAQSGTVITEGVVWGDQVGDIPAPGDYDGDGTADIAYYNRFSARWHVKDTLTGEIITSGLEWGLYDDIPVPEDYDGDGTTDYATWSPSGSLGYWHIYGAAAAWQCFGNIGDIPIPGDFDGDGTCDRALLRTSGANVRWLIREADGNNYNFLWGYPDDRVIRVLDYNGDGVSDPILWRFYGDYHMVWFLRNIGKVRYGYASDIPVTGDFDGNGAYNFGTFRPGERRWYIFNPSGPNFKQRYGESGDTPVVGQSY
ncbi:MAG: GEVED domain-containing protein [PVC group bacterium]